MKKASTGKGMHTTAQWEQGGIDASSEKRKGEKRSKLAEKGPALFNTSTIDLIWPTVPLHFQLPTVERFTKGQKISANESILHKWWSLCTC